MLVALALAQPDALWTLDAGQRSRLCHAEKLFLGRRISRAPVQVKRRGDLVRVTFAVEVDLLGNAGESAWLDMRPMPTEAVVSHPWEDFAREGRWLVGLTSVGTASPWADAGDPLLSLQLGLADDAGVPTPDQLRAWHERHCAL